MFNDPNNNLIKLGGNPCELRATRFVSGPLTDRPPQTRAAPSPGFSLPHCFLTSAHTHLCGAAVSTTWGRRKPRA